MNEEDQTKWRDTLCAWVGRPNVVQMPKVWVMLNLFHFMMSNGSSFY